MSDTGFAQTIQLTDDAILAVTGPDSERFLQGQLTCNVVKLADQHWQTGACCTAKGRMVANFIIARRGSDFYLRLPATQADALQQHLSRYAVFYKTEMTIDERFSIYGQIPAQPVVQTLAGQHPLETADDAMILSWPDGRRELWSQTSLPAEQHSAPWDALDIDEGIVWVTTDSQESWVPQFVDMTAQGAVSFSKGCYTGQEVVARLQYLSKNKKHLIKAVCSDPLSPAIGAKVTDDGGKNIGEVAAWSERQGLIIVQGEVPTDAQIGENRIRLAQLFYTEEMSAEESAQSTD
ncbi:MAG: hypothetical protein CMI02_03150 [Oceanospirillaceae bacterium]|nr:hypothetical protein [Oceanospirillaceae bacterium]MBT11014.1 hypothetical protein [Oceanospirillaceae bacterium]|tara:strand:+ start:51039 stop:51917 length:879 start_codon:yes stop_codon:yes gene_type:complete